jgi:mRNA interferase MazF
MAMADLTVVLQPNSTNGCRKVSYLLPQNLICVAKTRITDATDWCVTPTELQQLPQLIMLVIGGFS